MPDRGKVMAGLVTCIAACNGKTVCLDCGYMHDYSGGCETQLLSDALALLKAQEPRVMEFDDVVGGDECWLEAVNGACGYADCYACTGTGEVQVFRCRHDNPQYIMARDYLKTWRCWTSRPTEEQRRDEPWQSSLT